MDLSARRRRRSLPSSLSLCRSLEQLDPDSYLEDDGEGPATQPGAEDALPPLDGEHPELADETKQDKIDPNQGLAAPVPVDRAKVLAELYTQLAAAKDADAAAPIVEAIEQVWNNSGSDTVDLLIARAEHFIVEADLDLAVQILDAVIDIEPEAAEAWHQRALVHYMRQDYVHALSDLRRALQLDPKHFKAINALGLVLEETGNKKAALEAYRKALEVNPFLELTRQSVEQLSRDVEGQEL